MIGKRGRLNIVKGVDKLYLSARYFYYLSCVNLYNIGIGIYTADRTIGFTITSRISSIGNIIVLRKCRKIKYYVIYLNILSI